MLFSAAIRRDLISLLKFPFLSHVQVSLCEISLFVVVVVIIISIIIIISSSSSSSCSCNSSWYFVTICKQMNFNKEKYLLEII